MGLDMFLEGREITAGSKIKLGYWRKHPNLHGFIVENFAVGVDECQEIPLTKANLVAILEASEADKLPHTEGFFFGTSCFNDKEPTREILERAISWIKTDPGRSVTYQASW